MKHNTSNDALLEQNLIAEQLGLKRRPTSCMCGGNEAWFLCIESSEISVGCVCHTDLRRVDFISLITM